MVQFRVSATVRDALHAQMVFDNIVGEIDEELCEATFGGRIIPEYGRECSVAEGLREALP